MPLINEDEEGESDVVSWKEVEIDKVIVLLSHSIKSADGWKPALDNAEGALPAIHGSNIEGKFVSPSHSTPGQHPTHFLIQINIDKDFFVSSGFDISGCNVFILKFN